MQDNRPKGNRTPPSILGNYPAQPCVISRVDALGEQHDMQFGGMSIRQTIALHAMCAMASLSSREPGPVVAEAFAYADSFLQFEYDEAQANEKAAPKDAPSLVVVPNGNGPRK